LILQWLAALAGIFLWQQRGVFFQLPFGIGFSFGIKVPVLKSVSPLASFFLLLRQKKETKEKATPDRSKARNKINALRR